MTVLLKKIDKHNWEEAIDLSVPEEQKSFVASNLYSIAQVQFLEDFQAMGVYLDDKMIGFTMFGIDPDDQNYWIYRLMIDTDYQGKGYGFAAVKLVIEEIRKTGYPLIMIGYNPENEGARKTYTKAGFKETEIATWGEQLAKLEL